MSVKKTISVAEFQEVVEREHYDSYQYSTENQPWEGDMDCIGYSVIARNH